VDSRDFDQLYVLPAADFAGYTQIRLDPPEVSFSERWDPNSNRSRSRGARRLSEQDIEQIRSSVANEFEQALTDEFRRGGYTLTRTNGEGVLRVTPMIVNLYVTAPGAQQRAGRSRTWVANTGHMTLVAEVRDSVTGESLARVVDTRQGRRLGQLQIASSVTNMADARQAFNSWAQLLRTGLDDARRNPVGNEGVERKMAEKETESQVH